MSTDNKPILPKVNDASIGKAVTHATVGTSLDDVHSDWLDAAQKKLSQFNSLQDNWDGNAAERPNDRSVELARNVLAIFAEIGFCPRNVDPSAEGGVCISLLLGKKYGDIECFNNGAVLAAVSTDGNDTRVWEIDDTPDSIRDAANRIRSHLRD